jgi:flagellar FliL protein
LRGRVSAEREANDLIGVAMADNEPAEAVEGEESAPPSTGKRKLIIIASAVMVLLLGGVGGYLLFFNKKSESKTEEMATAKPTVFMDVPEVMVNMATSPGERTQYLKVKVVLEVKDQPLVALIQPALPRVMDIFQTYLRELRPSDLNGSAGMFRLKEELTRRVNVAVSPNQVNAVLFKEILVQ